MFYKCLHLIGIPLLISQSQIVAVLTVVVVFFLILLILGIRKSYILKKENDNLYNTSNLQSDDDNETYNDFRNGHLYENK